jgi:hypothetical protein
MKNQRRYTLNEARAIIFIRAVVLIVSLPFLLVLRGIAPETYERLGSSPSLRLVDGSFYP